MKLRDERRGIPKDVQKEIKFLINSDNRLKILECLFSSPQTIKSIQAQTDINLSSISININDLEKNGFITIKNDVIRLTNNCKLLLINIYNLNDTINLVNDNKDFLNAHMVKNYQFRGLSDLSQLKGCKLVESTTYDVFKTTRIIKDLALSSKSSKTIFPYMHPQLIEMLDYWAENDVDVKLILDEKVSHLFRDAIKEYGSLKGNISVKTISRKIEFALAVTENKMFLGLYKDDGKFDYNAVYISEDLEAINWANNVFREYEYMSEDYEVIK